MSTFLETARAALRWNDAGQRPDIAASLRSLIDAFERVEAIHRPKRGESARYALDDWEHEGEPTHFEPYIICQGDGASWPCATARALGIRESGDPS